MADKRRAPLQAWVRAQLPGMCDLQPAAEDASFRRHYRVEDADGRSWFAVDAPPEHENASAYVDIVARLCACGVHVPEVQAADCVQGFLLVSDLGRECYLDVLTRDNADRLYADAVTALVRMQVHADVAGLPDYGAHQLQEEMQLFEDWLIDRYLALPVSAQERDMLQITRGHLAAAALAQPRVFVHRDYHSRNLMYTHPNPGVLDFQDAVLGPYTYDLVSLLKDCYMRWPGRLPERVTYYLEAAVAAGLPYVEPQVYMQQLDLMGAQRHLKAAGIFARLSLRDGKPAYLEAIPRTLHYIAALNLPETAALADWITERVLPAVETACER